MYAGVYGYDRLIHPDSRFIRTSLIHKHYLATRETPQEPNHKEDYYQHCMMVIGEMAKRTKRLDLLYAAILHDFHKTQCRSPYFDDDWCLERHNEISISTVKYYASDNGSGMPYNMIWALIRCHEVPNMFSKTAENYEELVRNECKKLLKKMHLDNMVDDKFYADLMLLHEADTAGTIQTDEDMKDVDARVKLGVDTLNRISEFRTPKIKNARQLVEHLSFLNPDHIVTFEKYAPSIDDCGVKYYYGTGADIIRFTPKPGTECEPWRVAPKGWTHIYAEDGEKKGYSDHYIVQKNGHLIFEVRMHDDP